MPALDEKLKQEYINSLKVGEITLDGNKYKAEWDLQKVSAEELINAIQNNNVMQLGSIKLKGPNAQFKESIATFSSTTVNGNTVTSQQNSQETASFVGENHETRMFQAIVNDKNHTVKLLLKPMPSLGASVAQI